MAGADGVTQLDDDVAFLYVNSLFLLLALAAEPL